MPDAVPFSRRHVGPSPLQFKNMLGALSVENLEGLVSETIPSDIRQSKPLDLPAALSEPELLTRAKEIANKNKMFRNFIGMGYYLSLIHI